MKEQKTKKQKRKLYFRILKRIIRIKYKRPQFIYLGGEIKDGSIILSNHEGTDAPLSLEIYHPSAIRMWGAHEMNSGLKEMYKYQTRVYYHEKKHWNLHLARLFCLIASPLTNLFYSGLDLISSYRDVSLIKTIRESTEALKNGENVVIFPEVSTKGYLSELEGFHAGFTLLCETCEKKGIDAPIYVSYYQKDKRVYIFDAPVKYSELKKEGLSKEQIADRLRRRCNELGKMVFDSNPPGAEEKTELKNA